MKKEARLEKTAVPVLLNPVPAAPEPVSAGKISAWFWVVAGLVLTVGVAAWGFPDRPWWSIFWCTLGLGVLAWGSSQLPVHPKAVKDPYYVGRLEMLCFLAIFGGLGWAFIGGLSLVLICAMVLVWAYLYGNPLDQAPGQSPPVAKTPAWASALALALLLAGTWLRFHNLLGVPNGVHLDEADSITSFEGTYSDHPNFIFFLRGIKDTLLNTGTFKGLGVQVLALFPLAKLGIHGLIALRMTQAIYGSLGLLAFYGMMHSLFGWGPALWSLAFFTFSRYGIALSRHHVYDSPRVFFECLVVWSLWKGLRGKPAWFLLSGALTGLMLYGAHYPQYVVPPLILVFLGLSVCFKKLSFSQALLGSALFLAGLWLFYFPMWEAIRAYSPQHFMGRANEIKAAPFSDFHKLYQALTRNFWAYIKQYTVQGDKQTLLSLPEEPIMDPWLGMLMFLGLIGSAVCWKRGRMEGAFFVGWFFAMLAPAVLSDIIVVPYRIGLQAPAMFGLAGLAAHQISGFPSCKPSRLLRLLGLLLMVYFMLRSAAWSYDSYFIKYPADLYSKARLGGAVAEMAREMEGLPADTEVVVSNSYRDPDQWKILQAMTRKKFRWATTQMATLFPQQAESKSGEVVFTEACDELFYNDLKSLFPNSELYLHPEGKSPVPYEGNGDQLSEGNTYCSFYIPAKDLSAGCQLILKSGGKAVSIPACGLGIPNSYSGPWPVDAEWQGSLQIPMGGSFSLPAKLPRGLKIQVDGRLWKPGEARSLSEGYYPFRAWQQGLRSAHDLPAVILAPDLDLSNPAVFRPASFSRGLRANYYELEERVGAKPGEKLYSKKGSVVASRIEPTLFDLWATVSASRPKPMPGAYWGEWTGSLDLPTEGTYVFHELAGQQDLKVWVDGKLCYPGPGCSGSGPCDGLELKLAKGKHGFRAVYQGIANPGTGNCKGPALMVKTANSPDRLLPMAWLDPAPPQ